MAGFRSRWMMPCACAAPRPCANCRPSRTTSFEGTAPEASFLSSDSPAMYSVTRKSVSSAVSKSWMVAMLGWFSLARETASWRNRLRAVSSARVPGGQDFYGNVAFQLLVVRKKHHSHPACADLLHDTVVAKIFPEHVPKHNGMLSAYEKAGSITSGPTIRQEVPSPIISAIQICGSIKKC